MKLLLLLTAFLYSSEAALHRFARSHDKALARRQSAETEDYKPHYFQQKVIFSIQIEHDKPVLMLPRSTTIQPALAMRLTRRTHSNSDTTLMPRSTSQVDLCFCTSVVRQLGQIGSQICRPAVSLRQHVHL